MQVKRLSLNLAKGQRLSRVSQRQYFGWLLFFFILIIFNTYFSSVLARVFRNTQKMSNNQTWEMRSRSHRIGPLKRVYNFSNDLVFSKPVYIQEIQEVAVDPLTLSLKGYTDFAVFSPYFIHTDLASLQGVSAVCRYLLSALYSLPLPRIELGKALSHLLDNLHSSTQLYQ